MKKKILIVSYEEFDLFLGLNTRVKGITQALTEQGFEVDIVVPTYKSESSEDKLDNGAILHRVKMINCFGKFCVPVLSRILFVMIFKKAVQDYIRKLKKKYDYYQSEQIYPFWCCYYLAKQNNAKVILDDPTMLECFVEEKFAKVKVLKDLLKKMVIWFESCALNKADIVICSSLKSQEYFEIRIKNNKNVKFYYLPNGVNINTYAVVNKPSIGNKIFFNCSLPFYQNMSAFYNLIQILKYLDESKKEYEVEIIVNNELFVPDEIKEYINYHNNIKLLTRVESIITHIQEADIVVLPYEKGHFLTAGSRLKAVEALACGKVVFSTDEGIDGVLGCVNKKHIFLCDDIKDMAEKIKYLLDNKDAMCEDIQFMQSNARNLIEEKYSWNSLVRVYNSF